MIDIIKMDGRAHIYLC